MMIDFDILKWAGPWWLLLTKVTWRVQGRMKFHGSKEPVFRYRYQGEIKDKSHWQLPLASLSQGSTLQRASGDAAIMNYV